MAPANPYPHPPPAACGVTGMRDLWECGRSADLALARKRVREFDASPAPALREFKERLLNWMDAKGYPA